MDAFVDISEDRIADLLRALPPAPAGWVEAAQELPAALTAIDTLVERAAADVAQREAVLADLEQALAHEGVEPRSGAIDELRRRLGS